MVDAGKSRQKLHASASAKHRATYRGPDSSDWVTRLHWKCKPGLSTLADAVATLLANLPDNSARDALESPTEIGAAPRFRGWYSNNEIGYHRMTDEIAKLIVVKFDDRPADEVVRRLKAAGFRYRPRYYDQNKVWTRPNDFNGRQILGEFEASLSRLIGQQPDL